MAYQSNRFFCTKCGKEGLPIYRNQGHFHPKFHKKKLYCIYCKNDINHIECKNEEDIYEFKMNFNKGVYANEAEESLALERITGVW